MMPLRPSRQLAVALTLLHLGALACLAPLALPLWLKAVGVLALGLSLVFTLRRSVLLVARDSIVALVPADDGMIRYVLRDGEEIDAEVLPDTTVCAFAAVLRLRQRGGRRVRSVLLLPDAMEADQFRRLRVWLRWRSSVSRGAS